MNAIAIDKLRAKLAADRPTFGLWVTLEAPSVAEMAVAAGLDWIVIDIEHGALDWRDVAAHLRTTVRSDAVALVRVTQLDAGQIKRALDLGADGIVVPWIESADQLRQAVAYANYPPAGRRGIGAERATAWGTRSREHVAEAAGRVLVVPMMESVAAAAAIDELLAVPGADIFYFGPADFSSSAGFAGQWEGPGVAEQLHAVCGAVRRAGKHCGVTARDPHDLRRRLDEGHRFVALGSDAPLLLGSVQARLVAAREVPLAPAVAALGTVPWAIDTPPAQTARPATARKFRVALTADLLGGDGQPLAPDAVLDILRADPAIEHFILPEFRTELAAEQLAGINGIVVLAPRVTAATLAGAGELLAIARYGVGFDSVDVAACTAADVLLLNTPGAVDRPVAEATVGWMIALSHHMLVKDRMLREGRWDLRPAYVGSELRERTFGAVGFGRIARAVVSLLGGFGMKRPLAFDPHVSPEVARAYGVELVALDELLAQADFVSIHCPLAPETRGLIGERELRLMKPTAYLLNTARGNIVDEAALERALDERWIAGAALDCFEREPLPLPHRWTAAARTILAPHCIAWTGELFRDIGRMACGGLVELAHGRLPAGVVNPEVLDRATFQSKWARLQASPTA